MQVSIVCFLWSSRKIFCNDTMQRSWIWLRKPQVLGASAAFLLPSFFVAKRVCRCQTCNSLWPQHQIRNWQIQWEGDQGALSTKTVSCWTGVTNNCSNNCRVEPKFNLLEAKCVFLFDVRSVFFLIFLFLCSRAGPQWLHHHRWLV